MEFISVIVKFAQGTWGETIHMFFEFYFTGSVFSRIILILFSGRNIKVIYLALIIAWSRYILACFEEVIHVHYNEHAVGYLQVK